jgi:hypothetical protein
MKATLTFDLNDSDDTIAHLRCVKSLDMALTLWHLHYDLRKQIERKIDQDSTIHLYDLGEYFLELVHDKFNEHGINVDELIV